MTEKKAKTPRTGVPPEGYVRVVIDFPVDKPIEMATRIDRDTSFFGELVDAYAWTRIQDMDGRPAEGRLVRMIKRTDDPYPQSANAREFFERHPHLKPSEEGR